MKAGSIESELEQKIKSLDPTELLEQLQTGVVMLVATSQLAAEWKRRFTRWQANQGNPVCATPKILAWNSWLAGLAQASKTIPVPLNNLQEMQLWERIIDIDGKRAGSTASARGLARHAAEAYRVMREYRIDIQELAGAGDEAEALARWIVSMQQALKQHGRVLNVDLPELLLPLMGSVVNGSRLLLDGFDRIPPMQQALLQALQEHGVSLASVTSDDMPAAIALTACADAETEYRHIARKIAETLDSHPQARIGVVLSKQIKDTETLCRILDETLLSPAELVSSTQTSMQSVTMAGRPLAESPLIHQLLKLLTLAGRNGALHGDLAPLLFSPGVKGYSTERLARAELDARLRENNRHYLNFKALLAMDEMNAMPQLATALRALTEWETGARPAGEWVKSLHSLLQATGFLQTEAADRSSGEIRQLNSFRDSLASLVAVDAVNEQMSWSAFRSLLMSVCNDTGLSGPVRYPQVTVLPLNQVASHRFDLLFAAGFDDAALPLPVRPIPLLPFALQKKYNLPGTSAAIAFAESQLQWQQLLQSAPVAEVSFSKVREERELRPSPFLAAIDVRACSCSILASDVAETEPFDDEPVVPVLADETVRGGSAVLKNQSACPFRAFAYHRLRLAPLGTTEPGIKASDKGSLLHQALEYIWQQLRSQAALLKLDEADATTLIDKAVEHAWQSASVTAPESTQQFERQRMQAVLTAWLEIERQRPPFSVERCEKPYRLELPESGPIHFTVSLKADRIDRDSEGRKILIDYKTGQKQSPGKWVGERMAEPQLPLYAMAEGMGVTDAVCFARVRNGDMGFEGLSGEETGIKKISVYKGNDDEAESWKELLACWRQRINALAGEFVSGRCDVSPRDAAACAYCGLEAVCRIDEVGINRDEEDDEA